MFAIFPKLSVPGRNIRNNGEERKGRVHSRANETLFRDQGLHQDPDNQQEDQH